MDLNTVKSAISNRDFELFVRRINTVATEDGSEAADKMIKNVLESLSEEELAWVITNMPEEVRNMVIDSGYKALIALAEAGGYEFNIDIWRTQEGSIKMSNDCYNYLMHNSNEEGKALIKNCEVQEDSVDND